MKEKDVKILTPNCGLRIGDLCMVNGSPAVFVKRGRKADILTLEEIVTVMYGMGSHCIIYDDNGTLAEF